MRTNLLLLFLLFMSCSGVNSDSEIPPKNNEAGVISLSIPEIIRTDSTYLFSLEIVEPDTLQTLTITEQINDNSPESETHQLSGTHLDTTLTRVFELSGNYEITISAVDRHQNPDTVVEIFSSEIVQSTELRIISLTLSNSALDTPPDGVIIEVYNPNDELIAEGEIENGMFEFETESSDGRSERVIINFSGHGFIDFSDEASHSSSAEFNFKIDPVPINIQTDFPTLTTGEKVTVDIRDYITSVDPDTDEPVSIEQVEFSNADNNLHIEEQDDFIYDVWVEGNTDESVRSAQITVHTLTNEVSETIEFPVEETETVTPGKLVIMPLGNSLTNDGRSREPIWNLLVADGHEVDFVGDQYQQGRIPDPDHEGVGGITIQEVIDKAEDLMIRHDPGYVNLMIGTNDIAWYTDEMVADIARRWNDLVQILLDSSGSDTYIIAATIPPVTSKGVGRDGRDRAVLVQEYNEAIRDYVDMRREAGHLIILADVEAELNLDDHLASDGVHLNAEGYEIMGTVYYEAITAALLEGQ